MNILAWMLSFVAGVGLGGLVFGGLWFTLKWVLAQQAPPRWLWISYGCRMGALILGLYGIGILTQHLPACVLGIVFARQVVLWRIGAPRQHPPILFAQEAHYGN